ncbi:SRA stem-loop-interacting RNA-binding protein, mitochondrial isoform X3 [Bubalus kerabau]|uniref:SRA stem-loop-interacting RNA-binding protein, mitochondrial isoform X3 n=1 Tax=Bubalus carabanensis TaxID=3119969 RepID=UPI00244EBB01|nr:SRA stem-loop-interacting RNA-binding protein, mitochondrial isoform X3 [Bubalus carabanensis]
MAASAARGAMSLRTNIGRPVAFVRKIPWTAASSELREHFAQFGHVRKCTVPFRLLISEHRFYGTRASVVVADRLSCGSWASEHMLRSCAQAQLPQGMWDLPRSRIQPASPADTGRWSLYHRATREAQVECFWFAFDSRESLCVATKTQCSQNENR